MKCPDELALSVYADGELPAAESDALARHLDVCVSCKEQARLLEAENLWLRRRLLDTGADHVSTAAVLAPSPATRSDPVWPLAAVASGLAVAMALAIRSVSNLEMPAGFTWLDPSGIQGQIAFLANVFFFAIEQGVPMIRSIASTVSVATSTVLLVGSLGFALRRKVSVPTAAMMAGLLLIVATPAEAIDIRRVENGGLTIPAGEVVDDTLVVFAQSINIDGTVTGSVIAFGLNVNIRGSVGGNVVAAARRVNIEGTVGGDVFGFAQTVNLAGQVAGNLWSFNESVSAADEANISGDSTVFGADGSFDGRVGRDLTMYGNLLSVGGLVERSVNFTGNQVIIRAPAVVGGDFSAKVTDEADVQINPGATIRGDRSIELREAPEFSRFGQFSRIGFYVRQLLRIATGFVLGLLLFWILPGLAGVNLGDAKTLAISGGVGFVALVATPIAAIVLAITIIGIPLALMTGALWVLGLYLAKIMVAQFLGQAIIGRKPNGVATAAGLLFGLVVVIMAVNVPYLGGLINFVLMIIGLGALVVGMYGLISGTGPGVRSSQAAE